MMSSTTPRRAHGFVEPLEARIAPATIFIGAKGLQENSRDTEYIETKYPDADSPTGERAPADALLNFVDIITGSINGGPANPNDLVAAGLRGTGATALDNTPGKYFYVHLHAGDRVATFTGGSTYDEMNPFISVSSGDAIAVFTDFNTSDSGRNNYDAGEFTGLVLSAGARVQINGGVNGDVVAALDTHKTKSTADDSVDFLKLVSNKENISNLRVLGGAVNGSVISGGSIDNIVLSGSVESVLTGNAANGHLFDFVQSPLFPNGRFTANIDPVAKTAGPGIGNGNFRDIGDRVQAGDGGAGGKGGSLVNLTVAADTDGFQLLAGHGGDAIVGVSKGGAGGSLSKINVQGTVDTTPNSPGGIILRAGDGGGTHLGVIAAKGGAGGVISAVTVGAAGALSSSNLPFDSVHVFAGTGGAGKVGGVGGSITSTNVTISTQDAVGETELELVAGDGGVGGAIGIAGGGAGAGGSLVKVSASNVFSSLDSSVSTHAATFVKAGSSGAVLAGTSATGAAGGTVKTISILAYDSEIDAGAGSGGKTGSKNGGRGGSVMGVTYLTNQSVIPNNMVINAGRGGDATSGTAGAGGVITTVKAAIADIQQLSLNTAVDAARGGDSVTGKAGAGGGIGAVDVTDLDKSLAQTNFLNGDVQVHGGLGGSGGKGGGAGGVVTNLRVEGDHMNFTVAAGAGGNATVRGKGGAGGSVSLTFLQSQGDLNGLDADGLAILMPPSGSVQGGVGGNGLGSGGSGGAGGDLKTVSLGNEGTQTLRAGAGGSGQETAVGIKGGAAGRGGSVRSSGLVSNVGSGLIYAGDAGVGGAAAGIGGSILGSPAAGSVNGVRALDMITIQAGNGTHGGSGGDISALGFEAIDSSLAPTGAVVIQAGNGSTNGKAFGRGGSIANLTGVASAHVAGLGVADTRLTAGNGAGSGGSISHITIAGGGAPGGIIVIEAGHAGQASVKPTTGGKGGSVVDVGIAGLDSGTILRSVAAGDGGAGVSKGGAGGSVDRIFVPNSDIGYRTGEVFGYLSQGGVFAGAGGSGSTVGRAGANGNVSNVTAVSISSIVAGGRISPIPHLAGKVSNVTVNGTTSQLLLNKNGIFVPDGDLIFTFEGQSTGLIASHSTAQQVQTALNSLSTIHALGDVTVTYTIKGGYVITFNNPGQQEAISSIEVVTRDVVASIQDPAFLDIFAQGGGTVDLPVAETVSGFEPFLTSQTTPGSTVFFATESTVGTAFTPEIQAFNLSALGSQASAQFTLTFQGLTTSVLTSTATAKQVEDALNLLPSVIAAGKVSVALTSSGPRTYAVTFGDNGRESLIVGQAFISQVETLDLRSFVTNPSNQYKLTFSGETTAAFLQATDGASQIQTALNKLATIQNTNKFGTGGVQVSAVSATPGVYTITFTENGFQPLISGFANVTEVQTITVQGASTSRFVIHAGDEVTQQFTLTSTAAQVQAALNLLPNIIALGKVTVVKNALASGSGSDFVVTFNKVGNQTSLTANLLTQQVQTIDLSGSATTNTDYTLYSQYPVGINETTPGTSVPLPSSDGTSAYTELPGDSARVATTTAGSATAKEVQTIFFGAGGNATTQPALQVGDLFILKFNDSIATTANNSNTVVIPYQTTLTGPTGLAMAVQNALNALPTLKGGVTVIAAPAPAVNTLQVTFGAMVDQPLIQIESNTPTPHPGQFALSHNTATNGNTTTNEVQILDLDNVIARGGTYKLSFAGQSTLIKSSSNTIVAGDILASLTGLSAIGDFGGVTVAEAAPPGSHLFTVTFSRPGDVPDITGTGYVPESEQLDLRGVKLDPRDSTGATLDPSNEFSLTFKGETSYILPQTATSSDIQLALNSLLTVLAEGTPVASLSNPAVKVYPTAINGVYRVDFNRISPTTPDEPNISISSGGNYTHEIQHIDLGSLSGYADGMFQLSFSYGGLTDTTPKLSKDATAQQVQTALNSLTTVINSREVVGGFTGQVAVTSNATGQFDVTFNSFNQKNAIEGAGTIEGDRYPITVTQTTHGTPGIVSVTEVRSGAATSQATVETTAGSATTMEHQQINLASFNNAGLGDFTLTFGSDTTVPLTFLGTGVAPDVTAVAQALNNLPSIKALNSGAPAVSVSSPSAGVYDVAFLANGNPAALVVNSRHEEIQQLDLGAVFTTPTAEFSLTFQGQQTASLHVDTALATPALQAAQLAADIKTALNNLPNVVVAGKVDVVSSDPAHPERYSVTFQALGDDPTILAQAGLTQSIQRVTLGDLLGRTDTDFKLTFNGQTTGIIDASGTAAQVATRIESALNGLNSIKDTRVDAIDPTAPTTVGQVHVQEGLNGSFEVTFDARGDVPNISGYSVGTSNRAIPVAAKTTGAALVAPVTTSTDGNPTTHEVQVLDLSKLTGSNTEFQIKFDNDPNDENPAYTTNILQNQFQGQPNEQALLADYIRQELIKLPSVIATGGTVNVVADPNSATSYDITFAVNGDQQSFSAVVGQHAVQTVSITELAKFRLPIVAQDTSGVSTEGDANTQEQQLIDLTGVKTDFTLKFGADRTIALPVGASDQQIQDALNGLQSVMDTGTGSTGMVQVASLGNHRVQITFSENGNQPSLTGTADTAEAAFRLGFGPDETRALQAGLLDATNGPLSAADLQSALNSLPSIQGIRDHQKGQVTVTLVEGEYRIDFGAVASQPLLDATGTFSQLGALDIHRLTDGAAGSQVAIPVLESRAGQTLGPVFLAPSVDGSTSALEAQTIDLTQEQNGGTGFTLKFGSDTTTAFGPSPQAFQIQDALEMLPSINNLGPNAVTVTNDATQPGTIFHVSFNYDGNQPQLTGMDPTKANAVAVTTDTPGAVDAHEIQMIDLSNVVGKTFQVAFNGKASGVTLLDDHANGAGNAQAIQDVLNNLSTVQATGGTVMVGNTGATASNYGTFTITFSANANENDLGVTGFPTTVQDGNGVTSEVQHIDVTSLQGVAGSGFRLTYNGGTTAAIDHLALASTVQSEINKLPQFTGSNAATVTGANGAFDITFNDTADHSGIIVASGGEQEIQHLDTAVITAGSGNFTLSFNGGTTGNITAGASGAAVASALNALNSVFQAGGVDVKSVTDSSNTIIGYDVTFRSFADQPLIKGNLNVFEQQVIDLHNIPNDGGFIRLSANGLTSGFFFSDSGPNAEAFAIKNALISLNLGTAATINVSPSNTNVFKINFLTQGSQPAITGEVNNLGISARVPASSTPAEIESAIDNVSISDVTLADVDGHGHYKAIFADTGTQLPLQGISRTHESIRIDTYAAGNFKLVVGTDSTYLLPPNASADQIRLALDSLNSVKDLGGAANVIVNPDSSFVISLGGDDTIDASSIIASQSLPLKAQTTTDGSAVLQEVQTIDYLPLGTFDAAKYSASRLVGAIADFNELNASTFHFIEVIDPVTNQAKAGIHYVDRVFVPGPLYANGNLEEARYIEGHYEDASGNTVLPTAASATHPFLEGDLPIDGIVMAKVIDEKTTNFVPEARVTQDPKTKTNVFFDNLNP